VVGKGQGARSNQKWDQLGAWTPPSSTASDSTALLEHEEETFRGSMAQSQWTSEPLVPKAERALDKKTRVQKPRLCHEPADNLREITSPLRAPCPRRKGKWATCPSLPKQHGEGTRTGRARCVF
jgi:hypothetical protein